MKRRERRRGRGERDVKRELEVEGNLKWNY